jgi:hypothetical protein
MTAPTEDDVDAIAQALCRAYEAARSTADHTDACWQAVARTAIELGARRKDLSVRERYAELLGTDSTNFLGTGLTLRDFMSLHSAEKLAASWALQPQEEKKRRREAVIRLTIELERIREKESFATRLAELAIESVIEGDWKMVAEWAEHFSFADECDEIRIHAEPVYAAFRELLLQVLRTGKQAAA